MEKTLYIHEPTTTAVLFKDQLYTEEINTKSMYRSCWKRVSSTEGKQPRARPRATKARPRGEHCPSLRTHVWK